MTISRPLIGQMEWCVHCGMGKGRRGGEWKCRECTEPGVPCTCLIIAVTRRGSLPGLPWPRGSLPFLETALRPTWYFPPLSLGSDHRDSAVNRKHISHEASGDQQHQISSLLIELKALDAEGPPFNSTVYFYFFRKYSKVSVCLKTFHLCGMKSQSRRDFQE